MSPSDFASPEVVQEAKEVLAAAKSKEDVVAAWNQYYLKVGHKRLGRMLIGKDSELKKGE